MKKVLIVALAVLPLGCSFYYSSESSVKTLTSPCRSSGSSADDDDEKEAYRDDVRDLTAAYAAAHRDLGAFERELGALARRHGISDWEADDTTYTAIGAGLRRARLGDLEIERFATAISRGVAAKLALIRNG